MGGNDTSPPNRQHLTHNSEHLNVRAFLLAPAAQVSTSRAARLQGATRRFAIGPKGRPLTRPPARRNPAPVRSKEEDRTNTPTSRPNPLENRQFPPLPGASHQVRLKRPHPQRGDTLSIIMSPGQHHHGSSTKVRLGATHHTTFAHLPRVTHNPPQEE